MTESEAKDYLEDAIKEGQCYGDEIVVRDDEEALKTAIKALEEIREYRAIGTIEECRKAREKEEIKELKLYGECEDAKLLCPSCGEDLFDLIDCGFSNCPYCGQAIE